MLVIKARPREPGVEVAEIRIGDSEKDSELIIILAASLSVDDTLNFSEKILDLELYFNNEDEIADNLITWRNYVHSHLLSGG